MSILHLYLAFEKRKETATVIAARYVFAHDAMTPSLGKDKNKMDCGFRRNDTRAQCVCAERRLLSKPLIALVSIRIAQRTCLYQNCARRK
jgi:hypothetical protein